MEYEEIMSLRKLRLNNSLRITAVAFVATMVLGSLNAFSQDSAPLAEGAPDEYVVQVGDTLWDIAATFLKDPWYWPEIWYVNPQVENPHLIYPGDVLGLVYIDGAPRVTNVRASSYRLSPEARVTPLTEAITSVPYDSVSAFLSTGVVLEKDQVDSLPYLVATKGDHLIAAAGAVEAGICALALRDGIAPANANLTEPDPACNVNIVRGQSLRQRLRAVLSNSLGFGGHNGILIFKKYY